ncbi:MAG: aldo/keto reductase, partial [Cyanobacteriota bacterium]|nr:aldo/keto reductase [Cyanobacteriota bacterium]
MKASLEQSSLPCRRFGRTGLSMPVLSLGGMRFQQSWTDLEAEVITSESQQLLQDILERAVACGFHHVETARHYGSSERQLGWALRDVLDPQRLLQSKVPPREDPKVFEAELALSFERLGCERLDLVAIHGL